MDYRAFVAAIRERSAALAHAAEQVPLEAAVPSCEWTMEKLVAHIARVQLWVALHVETRATARIERDALPAEPVGAALLPFFREATVRLVTALEGADPATPMWTFTAARSAAFWARRQAHEVTIHAWDAQDAAGQAEPVAAPLAADGIDELLTVVGDRFPERFVGTGSSLCFRCTDAPGEWLVTLAPSGLQIARTPATGDVQARGNASDLDLFLWNRIDASRLEVVGDAGLLARFQTLVAH